MESYEILLVIIALIMNIAVIITDLRIRKNKK